MSKKLSIISLLLLSFSLLFAKEKVVASTSWTAAFADIAGVDNVTSIAPASLRHPPEYELVPSDIVKINGADYFIYAGFERMMKTLGENTGKAQMIQVTCDNSIETVSAMTAKIAKITGTEKKQQERLERYIKTITDGKEKLSANNLSGARVLCNKNQIYLAKDLGLEIAGTFGPGEVTAEQIEDAKSGNYDFIIDNVHNPVGQPLASVSKAKYIIWRNFPEKVEKDALIHVIQANINTLF